MQTEVAEFIDKYEGAGALNLNNGYGGDPCKITWSSFQVPTTISGPPIEDNKLKLKFTFQPAVLKGQVTCPEIGALSGSQPIDLNSINLPEFEFGPEGGTQVVHRQSGGLISTVIVTVQPKP
jgi:hypothetical protein